MANVVTAGRSYIDIDAYASMVAYRELLKLQGEEAKAVSTAEMNGSITPSLRALPVGLDNYAPMGEDKFIIVDLSNPEYLDKIVDLGRVTEVVDHHPGFEEKWEESRAQVQIEKIGAVATMIYERYREAGMTGKIQPEVARLMLAAILDNTLNFQAKITTERDKQAYAELLAIAGVAPEFAAEYFGECQREIEKDLPGAIKNDVKTEERKYALPDVFGQVAVWDAKGILARREEIRQVMGELGAKWLVNIISLGEGRSYVLASDEQVVRTVWNMFDPEESDGDVVVLQSVWLRKEMMAKALEKANGDKWKLLLAVALEVILVAAFVGQVWNWIDVAFVSDIYAGNVHMQGVVRYLGFMTNVLFPGIIVFVVLVMIMILIKRIGVKK